VSTSQTPLSTRSISSLEPIPAAPAVAAHRSLRPSWALRQRSPGCTPSASARRPIVSRSTRVARPVRMFRAVLISTPAFSAKRRAFQPFRSASSSTRHLTAMGGSYPSREDVGHRLDPLVILSHRRAERHMTLTTGVEAPSGRERQETCDVRARFKEVNCVHRYEVFGSTFGRRHQVPAGHFRRWWISNALDIFAFEYAISDRDHIIGCWEVPLDAQKRTQPLRWPTQSRG